MLAKFRINMHTSYLTITQYQTNFFLGELSEIDECETISSVTGRENGSDAGTHITQGRRQSLMSMTSLDDLYDKIPNQYISTIRGKRDSDPMPSDELLSMMQLSAGERNCNMSISSEVHNAELMIRYYFISS